MGRQACLLGFPERLVRSFLSKVARGVRPAGSEGGRIRPRSINGIYTASTTVTTLYFAARTTSCPPGTLPQLATQGTLREALVRDKYLM